MSVKRRSGLGSLIPGADVALEGITHAAIAHIAVNPYQPRRVFAEEALAELADSIRRYGVLQPLTVRTREGGYELIAGERRLQASRRAGLTVVPVVVREATDTDMVALALVENLQREDLSALEAAHSYHQLVHEFGLSHGEVAELVGKSRTTVANALRLLTLTESAQTALSEGRITEGHARALLAIGEQDRRDAVLREVVERGLSVREAESLANPAPLVRPRAKAAPTQEEATHPVMQNVLDNLQRALGTRVRLKPGSTMKRGVLEIEYYSAEDLDRVYEVVCD